ncbi:hypothetical protein PPBDW_I21316 [Photobacterium kishitanii]|nr:hypothetical protein PPBDW_I21316 [Photobacterium kishitanii]
MRGCRTSDLNNLMSFRINLPSFNQQYVTLFSSSRQRNIIN